MNEFGHLVRELRTAAGVSLSTLARHMGVSVPYVSDVERNNRIPFTPEKIIRAAALFDVDPTKLLRAAAEQRGYFRLDARNVSPLALTTGTAIMRAWPPSEDQLRKILEILGAEPR